MRKVVNIVLGWWFFLANRNNYLAQERLKICAGCKSRIWFVCGECGCPLQMKARVLDETCPLHKWPINIIEGNAFKIK